MKAYTMREMKGIVDYLVKHKAYGETKGRKMWMDFASSTLTKRTWQSLKETFLKRILPDISNPYYTLSMEQIRSFRQGHDFTTRDENKLDSQTVNGNVKVHGPNAATEENMEVDHDSGEEDSQSIKSHRRSSAETLIMSQGVEEFNNKQREQTESENQDPTTLSDGIRDSDVMLNNNIEVRGNATETASLSPHECVPPPNIDKAKLIQKSNSTEFQNNKSLSIINKDKGVNEKQSPLGSSTHQQPSNKKDISISKENVQNINDSGHPDNPKELLKGFNNEEIAKAKQSQVPLLQAKNRITKGHSIDTSTERENLESQQSKSAEGDCPEIVITINDSCDHDRSSTSSEDENVEVGERFVGKLTNERVSSTMVERLRNKNRFSIDNAMCSKSLEPSIRSSTEDQRDRQSTVDRNRRNGKADNKEKTSGTSKEKGTNEVVVLNSHSDSDSDSSPTVSEPNKRKRTIARMERIWRNHFERVFRFEFKNLDLDGPRRKCDCRKTCVLPTDDADSDASEISCHRSCECHGLPRKKRRSGDNDNQQQPEPVEPVQPVEFHSSDDDGPPKTLKEISEFWNSKFAEQDRKSDTILKTLRKFQTKLQINEHALACLQKQVVNDKKFAIIDLTSNPENEGTSNVGSEDIESDVRIRIITKNQDIRLKGEWKDIRSEFKEVLQIFKIGCTQNNDIGITGDNDAESRQEPEPVRVGASSASKGQSSRGNSKNNKGKGGSRQEPEPKVTVRAGASSTKGQSSRGNSKNNKGKGGRKDKKQVRKSPRVKELKRKRVARNSGGQDDDDNSLKLPTPMSSPAMSFIQSDYQYSVMSSPKMDQKKQKYSVSVPCKNKNEFQQSLKSRTHFSSESTNKKIHKIIHERKISNDAMQGIYENHLIFNRTQTPSETNLTANTSSMTLPPSPEISSIKNLSSDVQKYTISDIDVSMPLMEQYCRFNRGVNRSISEESLCQPKYHTLANIDSKFKTKVQQQRTLSETVLSNDGNANIAQTQSVFASLKDKLKYLFLGRAKETKPRSLTNEKSMVNRNIMKAKKPKNRTSTPFNRKSTRKFKPTYIEPLIEECVEFCSEYLPNASSIKLLHQKNMSDNNKPEKIKSNGNEEKEDVIKVKIHSVEVENKFISKSSKASLCGSFDFDSDLQQDSFEFIHNHSENCLFADEQGDVRLFWPHSATATPLNSTLTDSEVKNVNATVFNPDLLNTDANDCYRSKSNNTIISGGNNTADSSDVSYDSRVLSDISREISLQPPLRVSMCYLMAQNQSINSNSIYPNI